MSLICVYTAHDRSRAEMVADTLAWDKDRGPAALTSKILPYIHAITCMGHRGDVAFLFGVQRRLYESYHGSGLDGMIETVAPIAREAQAYVVERWGDASNELFLVGYSPSRRGFAAMRLRSDADFEPAEMSTGAHFSGVERELPYRANPLSVGEWIHAANALKRDCGADGWIGGDLVLHTLTAAGGGSITIEKVHRFHDYQQTLEQIRERWTT